MNNPAAEAIVKVTLAFWIISAAVFAFDALFFGGPLDWRFIALVFAMPVFVGGVHYLLFD